MSEAQAKPERSRRGAARELRVLNSIAEALNGAADVQQALERTLALVADLLGLRTGWVWLVDPQTERFYSAAALNLPPYLREPVRMTGKSCYCIDEFRQGSLTPKNIHLIGCSRLGPAVKANDTDGTQGLCCHASIPLCFGERPLGIMNITAPEWRELTAEELRLLSTIAYQVGVAIDRARLAETAARAARVEERARIAREIHDTLAQGLTAIGLHLESALTHLESRPEITRQRVERALETARDNLEEARRSVHDLRAFPGEGRLLEDALRSLARSFTAETGVRVRTRLALGRERALPERVESELYRIARESLTNVQKHAGATAVTLSLEPEPGGVRLRVQDNGVGFGARPAGRAGQGVPGMRERARLLGGSLRVSSRPGRGTTVAAHVPLAGEDRT